MSKEPSLAFHYLSSRTAGRMASFMDPIVNRVSTESEFGLKNKAELEKLDLAGKLRLLEEKKYGALVAFSKETPIGLIAFQDHPDGSRHAFLVHTLPEHRGRGVALACLKRFVRDGFKKGFSKLRVSIGASGRETSEAIVSLLKKFEELHAAGLGVRVNIETGFF